MVSNHSSHQWPCHALSHVAEPLDREPGLDGQGVRLQIPPVSSTFAWACLGEADTHRPLPTVDRDRLGSR